MRTELRFMSTFFEREIGYVKRTHMYPPATQLYGLVSFGLTSNPFLRIILSDGTLTEILCGGHRGGGLNSRVAPFKNLGERHSCDFLTRRTHLKAATRCSNFSKRWKRRPGLIATHRLSASACFSLDKVCLEMSCAKGPPMIALDIV